MSLNNHIRIANKALTTLSRRVPPRASRALISGLYPLFFYEDLTLQDYSVQLKTFGVLFNNEQVSSSLSMSLFKEVDDPVRRLSFADVFTITQPSISLTKADIKINVMAKSDKTMGATSISLSKAEVLISVSNSEVQTVQNYNASLVKA